MTTFSLTLSSLLDATGAVEIELTCLLLFLSLSLFHCTFNEDELTLRLNYFYTGKKVLILRGRQYFLTSCVARGN